MASTLTLGREKNVTLGSSNVVTQIVVPALCTRIRVLFRTHDGKLSRDTGLTDGGSLGSSDYETCLANVPYEVPYGGGALFLASADGSTVVELTAIA